MKRSPLIFGRKIIFALIGVLLLPLCSHPVSSPGFGQAFAQAPETDDKTLSPYFFVKSDDPTIDQLPLKSTSTVVNVSGTIADVAVTQVYKNEGKKPIEALYVFPASTRAAVYGMKMTIGERTITAEIQKREDARRAYEQAKQEGKSASLLEQNRPNVFQMNVANILPGDEIKTELHYSELLVPTGGIYEFVYPTVVGPRYSNQPASTAPASEKWSQNPYLHSGEPASYSFDIKIGVAAGVPIQEMSCSSHKTSINYQDKMTASIELDPSEHHGGNRDFILKYRLAGNQIESGLLLYEGQSENFFLLMMQPPKRVEATAIPPREYIFIVDVSGSMYGYPLEISKKLFKDLISGLRPIDTFNLLLFSGGSKVFSERSVPANQENIRQAVALIAEQQGGGGTELLPAMKRALTLPRTEGASRTIVIATDGYVTVEPEVFDLIREFMGNANFFPFGIGTSVNRHIIEGMAHVGAGEPFVITKADEAPIMAEKFRQYVNSPLLTQTKLDFGKFETYDVEPLGIPDLFAERPIMVYGKWKGKPQGTITLSGRSGENTYTKSLDVAQIKPLAENSALKYLWARSRVMQLSDYNRLQTSDERIVQITELGMKYNLLTAYTSFIAIDSEVRRQGENLATVNQPLPLPEGVSDYAVGGPAGGSLSFKHGGQFRARFDAQEAAPAPMSKGTVASPPAQRSYENKKLDLAESRNEPVAPKVKEESSSKVTIEKLSVRGSLSELVVRQSLEQNLPQFSQCVQKVSKVTLTLKWIIGKDGMVRDVHITMTGGTRKVKDCLDEQMEKWRFPVPIDGNDVHVAATVSISN
jgi:Ca-activated chloride channel homolog